MSRTAPIEPFEGYQAAGVLGKPFLSFIPRPRGRGTVSWSDGTLFHYPEFTKAIEASPLDRDLADLWKAWEPTLPRNATLSRGGVIGVATGLPRECAEAFFEVVKQHFTAALQQVLLDRGGNTVRS